MHTAPFPALNPREFGRLLLERRKLWAAPAIICGVLATGYALVMPRYWDASQALVVRQDTAGARGPAPGKFADLYEMRTLQETILELAKSQQVVVNTLKSVDQRLTGAAAEPTAEDVEKFRRRLKMLPPDGGEFGKTEVFYFSVRDGSRERAIELVSELCRQLDQGLKALRSARAAGLVAELQQQVALATEINGEETQRLREFESQVGTDLGELRMLHSGSSGQSDLRQESVQLEADLRKFETQVREAQQLLAHLQAAKDDPLELVATPNSLLSTQPALRQLKDGLVEAQLTAARLGGNRSPEHPRVKAAAEAQRQIRADLHNELVTAIRGAEVELQLGQERLAAAQARTAELHLRFNRLAEQRAEYANRIAAADNSRVSLDQARQTLNTAKAALAAAQSGSLVTRLDQPETGPYPAGPGRTVVVAAGVAGGLMIGLALVFLTAAAPESQAAHDLAAAVTVRHAEPRLDAMTAPVRAPSRPTRNEDPLAAQFTTPPVPSAVDLSASEAEPPAPVAPLELSAATHDLFPLPAALAGGIELTPRAVTLPAPSGALPSAAGALPTLAGAHGVGLSLQEALQAARLAHGRRD